MTKIVLLLIWHVALFSASTSRAQPGSDSLEWVRDSLEISLLRTTRTYQQVEQLLVYVPAQSTYLNLLPSVLPVDLPLTSFRVSSPFGIRRHPINRQMRFHGGVDVKAPLDMVVKSTAPGVVRQVGHDPALGVFIRILHAWGFETTYGHLNGYCVKPGQSIGLNQEIGRVGQTGLATGPHLHYEIKKNGSVVDPYEFCFLLRRRLWLAQRTKPIGSSDSVSDSTTCRLSNE